MATTSSSSPAYLLSTTHSKDVRFPWVTLYLLLLFGSVLLCNRTIQFNSTHTHDTPKYFSLILRHVITVSSKERLYNFQTSCTEKSTYESTNGRPKGVSLSCSYVTLAVFEGTLLIRSTTMNLSELSTLCKQRKEINFTKLHDGPALLEAGGGVRL